MSNENCSGVQGRDFQPSDQAADLKGQHVHPAGEQPAFVPASPQGRPAQLACAAPVFSAELKASADVPSRNFVISALNSSSGSWISGPLAFTALIAAPRRMASYISAVVADTVPIRRIRLARLTTARIFVPAISAVEVTSGLHRMQLRAVDEVSRSSTLLFSWSGGHCGQFDNCCSVTAAD